MTRIEGRSDAEHDVDVLVIDLNAFDQKADQVPLQRPIDSRHPIVNLPREVLKPAHDQRQGRAVRDLVPQGSGLLLPGLDPLAQPNDARRRDGRVRSTVEAG